MTSLVEKRFIFQKRKYNYSEVVAIVNYESRTMGRLPYNISIKIPQTKVMSRIICVDTVCSLSVSNLSMIKLGWNNVLERPFADIKLCCLLIWHEKGSVHQLSSRIVTVIIFWYHSLPCHSAVWLPSNLTASLFCDSSLSLQYWTEKHVWLTSQSAHLFVSGCNYSLSHMRRLHV